MWGPHTKRDINILEGVQKFAHTEQYSSSYEDILSMANLLVLKSNMPHMCKAVPN